MSDVIEASARLLAVALGRVIPVRSSFSLCPDPDPRADVLLLDENADLGTSLESVPQSADWVFGIAPIRVVSEEQVQAIAFGRMSAPPQIITRWNPLGRQSDELEPFTEALDAYLQEAVQQSLLPRIWVPYRAALDVVELLGHRYRTNKMA